MKNTRNALAAVSVASLALSSMMLAAPAQALELDVSGTTFNFANPGDADILVNSATGASYFYENIATVNGSQIDATVTFTDASLTSMGMNDYSAIDQDEVDFLNGVDINSVDVPGCYSSQTYLDALENNDVWWDTFFLPGDLLVGEKIKYVDEFMDDSAIEGAINTDVDLCEIVDPTNGYVELRVDFEVGGSPVTLNNLELFAGDIDGLQSVTFFDPMPTTYTASTSTQLTITEVPGESVEFKAPDVSSDEDEDPNAADFVGEVTYSGVSSVSYRFGLEDAGSGSLSMLFDSYFDSAPSLANTGVDVTSSLVAGGSMFVLGTAAVLLLRRRRQGV